MKKRMLCFALCLVLLLPMVLSGCKKQTDLEEKFQQTATTLTMWVVTKDETSVSKEAKEIVTAKLDEITKDRFKIHLVVNYIPESVYRETLDNEIRGFYATRENISPKTGEDEAKPAETEVNEWGITVIKYPALLDHQVDIIYLEGEDMFKEYAQNGWLSSLNIELNGGNSNAIRENVNSHLLNAASYNGSIYAIPNNHTVGEYTVMLLNKSLADETGIDACLPNINGLFNDYIYNYLDEIKAKGDSSILPINASYEECLNLLAYFWNINPDTFENEGGLSVIGYRYEDLTEISRSVPLQFQSLFTDPDFTKAFLNLKKHQFDGSYGELTEGQTAALSIETMDYATLCAYRADDSEYYPIVIKNPTISAEDVYGSMFGVCSQTESLTQCMKVVTLLNTNAEFRTLLQYGVEGKTYKLIPDPLDNNKKTVSYSTEYPYHMDIFKTGNAFLTYPEPDMDENIWENGKVQNRDISGADPTLDLDFHSLAIASMEEYDIQNGAAYQVRLNTGMAKSSISSNPVIWGEWFNTDTCKKAADGSLQVLQSQKTMANGKLKYTYLVYAPGLEYEYGVFAKATSQNNQLTVRMDFDDTSEWLYETDDDGNTGLRPGARTYALWLVTVETDQTIESVIFDLYRNGEQAQPNVVVPGTDPEFTYCGTLNAELIRYLYNLNAQLVERIENCANMDELKALLVEIKRLLTPHEDREWYMEINELDSQNNQVGYAREAAKYTVLSDLIATWDLEEINYAVRAAISTEYVPHKDAQENQQSGAFEFVEDEKYDSKSSEEYEQLSSPYAIYNAWLKNNKYIQ